MKHYAKLVIALFAILCPTAGFAQKDYAAEKALITKVKRLPHTYMQKLHAVQRKRPRA